MIGLTPTQSAVLDFIAGEIRNYLSPPTIREICKRFGWSGTNAASEVLRALAKKGWTEIDPGMSRGIILTDAARDKYGLWFKERGSK